MFDWLFPKRHTETILDNLAEPTWSTSPNTDTNPQVEVKFNTSTNRIEVMSY